LKNFRKPMKMLIMDPVFYPIGRRCLSRLPYRIMATDRPLILQLLAAFLFPCRRRWHPLSCVLQGTHMRDVGELSGQFGRTIGAVVAFTMLLFPGSGSILCTAPGGHIAIEGLNAPCCAPSDVSAPAGSQPQNGVNATADCHNCTDVLVIPSGQGTVIESYLHAAASPCAVEYLDNRPSVDISISLCRASTHTNIDAPIPPSSVLPLRR